MTTDTSPFDDDYWQQIEDATRTRKQPAAPTPLYVSPMEAIHPDQEGTE